MDEKNQRHESLYSNGPKWNHFCELVEKKRSTVNEPCMSQINGLMITHKLFLLKQLGPININRLIFKRNHVNANKLHGR